MRRLLLLLPLLSALGCAARHPDCHLSPGAPGEGYQVRSSDGLCLQGHLWTPADAPRAVVVAVHGIRDHGARYAALGQALSADGILVVAQDHRGHGLSGGKRQRFDSIEELDVDLGLAIEQARARAPGVPLFLYGHSLGGLVATHRALRDGDKIAGLVLSGPALMLPDDVKPSEIRAAKLFGSIAPGLRAQAVDDTMFVRDPAAKAELAADPLVDHFNLPARSASAAVRGIEEIYGRLASVSVPLLVMHGLADVATNPEGSRQLGEQASSGDKTLRLYDGMFHDLLHEPESESIVDEVTRWIDARLPAVAIPGAEIPSAAENTEASGAGEQGATQ